ncbi:MAG TPA: enoyl-CoA hydratase [Candidatus Baltobacteraceae bacterium]|nr:enoyl-CoA hydratase [Candidatus Baltobacteraceae bacterium]
MIEQSTYKFITTGREDGCIAVVTMARPDKRNALFLELMRELIVAFDEIGADRNVRAVILRGEGPAFSAGHDLRELQCRDAVAYREIFDTCVQLMERIQHVPQPVIAEVGAVATAAGCQLVATCDLAVASEDAKFATPGVRIGLFCTTPMVALSRAVGRKRAMEMLLTGDFVDARTAAEWGLVNRVVPAARLHEEALVLARKIAEASEPVVGLGKAAFYVQIDLAQDAAYRYAKEVMSLNAMAEDAQEGISAFLERRPPAWH